MTIHTKRQIRIAIALILSLLLIPAGADAQEIAGDEDPRFTWNDDLEGLFSREYPDQLSRPLAGGEAVNAAVSAAIPVPGAEFSHQFDHYTTSVETGTFLRELNRTYPKLMKLEVVGRSSRNRVIYGVRIGNEQGGDPDNRPALYLDGQHHAREAISSQVVLYTIWYLLAHYDQDATIAHLLNTRTLYAIPMVNPDGNEVFLQDWQGMRRTANTSAADDDGDGHYDEDPYEGAGYSTVNRYTGTFDQAWVDANSDNPFTGNWFPHLVEPLTFVGVFDSQGTLLAQQDNDNDGLLNEDPPGGVDANRNYDAHWELGESSPASPLFRGSAPFSEPETMIVRDFVADRATIVTAASYHSGSDLLLHPWGWSATATLSNSAWYEALSRKGSELTEKNGFQGSPHGWAARALYDAAGTALDWLHSHGIFAWTPEVFGASTFAAVNRIGESNTYELAHSIAAGFNPPEAEIVLTADRWLDWNLYLLAATPNLGLDSIAGTATEMIITVANDGLIALDLTATLEINGVAYTQTVNGLSSKRDRWTVDIPPRSEWTEFTLHLSAVSPPNEGISIEQTLTVNGEIHQNGRVRGISSAYFEPFQPLSGLFDGWSADAARWDTEDYHLGDQLTTLTGTVDFQAQNPVGPVPHAVSFDNQSTGNWVWAEWNFGDGTTAIALDPDHTYQQPGVYDVTLTVGGYGEEITQTKSGYVEATVPSAFAPRYLLLAFAGSGVLGTTPYRNEDVLAFDQTTGEWTMLFDGSDLGLAPTFIDGFSFSGDSLLLSIGLPMDLPGVGYVADSDIIRFGPTTWGTDTQGTLEAVVRGQTLGLTTTSEDIDALAVTGAGDILFSTLGSAVVPSLSGRDEDIIAYTPSTGELQLYFDGSDVGLEASTEDIRGLMLDPVTGSFVFATYGAYSVNGLTGSAVDLLTCHPLSLGGESDCIMDSWWDASAAGLAGETVLGLSWAESLPPLSTSAAGLQTGADGDDQADDDQSAMEDELDMFSTYLPIIR